MVGTMTDTVEPTSIESAWAVLQKAFDSESVSLLPRYVGGKDVPHAQRDKHKCPECGVTHEFPCIHLSYVGHADITMRLNEADPEWTWEPMGYEATGLPALDANGGLWAFLTVLSSRKPAYGDPGLDYKGNSKAGTPDGMKEAIGDMLRNGAMRFGVGTALWSKSDKAKATLVGDDDGTAASSAPAAPRAAQAAKPTTDAGAIPEGGTGAYVVTFGKNGGKSLAEIDRDDHGYILWLASQDGDKPAFAIARAFLSKFEPPVVEDDTPDLEPYDTEGVPF
jgi:hypothetical protein